MLKFGMTSWCLVSNCWLMYDQCNIHWYQRNEPYICVISGSSKAILITNVSIIDIILVPWCTEFLPLFYSYQDNRVGTGTGKYKAHQLFRTRQGHACLVPMRGLMRESDYASACEATRPEKGTFACWIISSSFVFKFRLFWILHCTLHMWNKTDTASIYVCDPSLMSVLVAPVRLKVS